jgi:hypothetical protein
MGYVVLFVLGLVVGAELAWFVLVTDLPWRLKQAYTRRHGQEPTILWETAMSYAALFVLGLIIGAAITWFVMAMNYPSYEGYPDLREITKPRAER